MNWRLYVPEAWDDTCAETNEDPETVPTAGGRGRPSAPRYRDKPSSLRDIALGAGQAGRPAPGHLARGTRTGPASKPAAMTSKFLAVRIRPASRDIPLNADGSLPDEWLICEWPPGVAEPTDYRLSSLPADTPIKTLVRLAKMRWRIEQGYRELKRASAWPTSKDAPSPLPPTSPNITRD